MYVIRNIQVRSRIIVAVEKQEILLISLCACARLWIPVRMRLRACSLANPECNAYASYCDVICGPLSPPVLRHYLINGAIFEKKSYWT
jgi:hypothetical protein